MATGPCYTWSAKSIFIKLTLVHTADVIVITTSTGTTMTPSTVATTNELCSCRDCCVIIPVTTIVPTIVAISILMIVILIWIYYRKRQIALINLTKYHKESDENSYTSSKHSHESESKSPDPEYDVIKINPATDKFEFKSKLDILCQEYSSVQSNEEDWDCGPMYSSVDTNAGSPHKIGDFNVNSNQQYTLTLNHILKSMLMMSRTILLYLAMVIVQFVKVLLLQQRTIVSSLTFMLRLTSRKRKQTKIMKMKFLKSL